jgi:hypothetical protein
VHTINEVSARVEALTLHTVSQTHIQTTTRTTLSFRLMPLSITLEQTSSREQQTLHVTTPTRTAKVFTVRLPKWFLHRQYEVQLLHTTSGWPFTFKACSIVPYDSPFFEACQDGDIETIKFLLANKQASIYDRDPEGFTAFHFAIGYLQLEVCKLLRHAGIFAQFDHRDYRNALRGLNSSLVDFTEHNLSLLRVAAPLNDPDQDWLEEYRQSMNEHDGAVVIHYGTELLFLLNSSQSDTAMLNLSHLRSYFECRIRTPDDFYFHSFMSYVARILSKISTVREITAARDKYAWIVYALASEIARTPLEEHSDLDTDQWLRSARQALCAALDAGLSPHQISGRLESTWAEYEWYQDLNITPLGILCVQALGERWENRDGAQRQLNQDANAKLQAWLSGLHSAGIDLLQYAESEFACYGYCPDVLVISWKPGASITVVTGPRPEDWRVAFWEPCESYARLFWSLMEGNPLMPGLAARILEAHAHPLSAGQDPINFDLPGSWPSEKACVVEELESWLLERTDDVLTQIEEDLPLLSEDDFFAKWDVLDWILSPPSYGLRL